MELAALGADLLFYILKFLEVKHFCIASVVCKKWKAVVDGDLLWKMKYCSLVNKNIQELESKSEENMNVSSWKTCYRAIVESELLMIGAETSERNLVRVKNCLIKEGCRKVMHYNFQRSPLLRMNDIKEYSSILCYSYSAFWDSESLGNLLADFIDQGFGGVVIACYGNCNGSNRLGGRWFLERYDPLLFNNDEDAKVPPCLGKIEYPDHPVMQGVKVLSSDKIGSMDRGFDPHAGLNKGAKVIAYWDNGEYLVVESNGKRGKILSINFSPVEFGQPDTTHWKGDGWRLIKNALFYVSRHVKAFSF